MSLKKDFSIRNGLSRIFLVIPSVLFLYVFFLLAFNVGRGFDITDESFYILWSRNPRDVLASITQFGHYTGILYSLANENLAVFRLLGLLLLLITAGFFWHSLERYWHHLRKVLVANHSRWLSLSVILSGTVAYYRYWMLTPSYNWLALISILLVAAGLLRAAVNAGVRDGNPSGNLSLLGYGLLVGMGAGLSFMAKPTTAAVLAVIFFYFTGVTSLRCRWKVFVAGSILSSGIFIVIHVIVFENGFFPFYVELRDGLELGKLLGSSHTIMEISLQAYGDLKQIPHRLIKDAGLAFLLLFFACVFIQYKRTQKKEIRTLFIIALILVITVTWIQLWKTGYWVGGQSAGTRIGFGGMAFSFVLFFSTLSTLVLWNNKKLEVNSSNGVQFRQWLALYVFLLLLAVAFAFGSANGLIRQMSGAFVFLSAASLYSAFWIDQYINKKYLGSAVSLLLVLSVCLVLTLAYENPYRLPTGVKNQIEPVTFTGNKGSIFVDKKTAKYVNDLKRAAIDAGWKRETTLIDLTGASPGTTVILGGRAPGIPWLMGGYKGSNDFARFALSMASSSTLNLAWVLTAPGGSIRLSNKILSHLDLNFPDAYKAVGKLKTGHRIEKQVLWRPLNTTPATN
jgi:hypothetical protein